MTLRLRLVLALCGLVVVLLGVFGAATYTLYARSEYRRLDTEIRDSAALVDAQLDSASARSAAAGTASTSTTTAPAASEPARNRDARGAPPVFVPPGTYAELRSASGAVLARLQLSANTALPKLPTTLPATTPGGRFFDVGAVSGSGGFRVLVIGAADGGTTVIAVPTTEVTDALRRLVLIEAVGSAALLLLLSGGSWLVLRRGLRPLERMAGEARSITAGDLSERVSAAGGGSEIGQLGLALNTMLDDIEVAFSQREQTEARLRRFLADASHELRTPLTSIQGFAELFRLHGEDARIDLTTILRRIEQESARMKELVDDLLLLAELDQARAPARAPVDVAVLAADACSDAVATAPDRAITLHAPEPVVVEGDEAHLRQAIANLVTNALRHTPTGAPVELGVRGLDGKAEISVRDHGAGLDADALAHVFDRFWQADEARVGAGAGLGLSIVAGIAAEHGGTATVANAVDGGAVFTLRLPRVTAPHHADAR